MIVNILIFIFILALLVLTHEVGHFWAARRAGMKVEEFGFGLPPRIWGKKIGDTIYSINALPVGGFVKIFGEEGQYADNPESFASKKPSARAIVLIAGVAMNFLLAMWLYIIGFTIGIPAQYNENLKENIRDIKLQVISVQANSPAKEAGIKELDIIKNIDGQVFNEVEAVRDYLSFAGGKEVSIDIIRSGKVLNLKVVPRSKIDENQGPTGMLIAKIGLLSYPFPQSIFYGIKETFNATFGIVNGFYYIVKNLITTGKTPTGVEFGGPVKIASLTFVISKIGIGYLISFIAILSLTLFIINIFPFPALDGGRLLFVIIEWIKGRPLDKELEKKIHAGGFVILLVLIIFLTLRDILQVLNKL